MPTSTAMPVLACMTTDVPDPLLDYLEVIRAMNPDGELRHYPGSPELARLLTREQDRLHLNEKHPEDGRLLKENMRGDRRVAVHLGEGWHVPRALLPTREKRALLLIAHAAARGALCALNRRADAAQWLWLGDQQSALGPGG